ncbi:MAG TPA: glycosyltransferase family 2 protein [candidate division Zixibacteria bacterium]|nr:glycosyltransferase family 2 protein [candidate division Zixibacteria bacterium]
MIFLTWLIIALTALLIAGVVYLWLLALVGCTSVRHPEKSEKTYRFLTIVPAYNEGEHLIPTLKSLAQIQSSHSNRVVVVADNCTDNTAEIAAGHGVEVYERHDLDRRGKGYAIEWIIEQVGLENSDFVLIVDADTIVDQNILEVLAVTFEKGAAAVQTGYYFVPDKKASPLALLQYMASLVENRLFYEARSRLGFHGLLRGTGMALRSKMLARLPWDSHSITEDVDYAVKIILAGQQVAFTAATSVYSTATVDYDQAATQKKRWASGTFALIADHFPALFLRGLAFRPKLIELAGALLLLSRPLMIYLAFVLMLLSLVLTKPLGWLLAGINLAAMIALIVYLLLGAFLMEDRSRALRAIAAAPAYGFWFIGVQLKSLLGLRKSSWERTERKSDADD